jgi:hypothetical protein
MDDVLMTEQPAFVLEEAVRLVTAMGRRMGPGRDDRREDVWSRATREEHPHLATGAPECRYCPICRTIAAARESGTDVAGHMFNAGQELYAAITELVAAYDRSRPPRASARGREGSDGDPIDIG